MGKVVSLEVIMVIRQIRRNCILLFSGLFHRVFNYISDRNCLVKIFYKMQEIAFQRHRKSKFSGGACSCTPLDFVEPLALAQAFASKWTFTTCWPQPCINLTMNVIHIYNSIHQMHIIFKDC